MLGNARPRAEIVFDRQTLDKKDPGPTVVTQLAHHVAEIRERQAQAVSIADQAANLDALLEEPAGFIPITASHGRRPLIL